jgi:PPK2 family polyphosphate:nucleotide phosphotransferase
VDLSPFHAEPGSKVHLDRRDPRATPGWDPDDRDGAEAHTAELNTRLMDLQELLWAGGRHRVLVVLQAIDAGGKDGTIRNVFRGVNPSGVRVSSFKRPNDLERSRDYLWRVHQQVPGDGEMVIFNRSHYEDVLIVRVQGLVPEEQWRRRYDHIVAFEQLLADEGTTIIKLFLHISADEQRKRLQARLDHPSKRWKFDPQDLEERRRWDDYQQAFREAIERTSTPTAPWYVIPADRKWYRNLAVSEILVQTLEGLELQTPPADPGLASIVVE